MQLVPEEREHDFDFDLLDATKIIPEEEVPLRVVGRMKLDRNPDNFFAETEQVAFHTANVVSGIDFTNDPLLQARNFSYLDTQLIRLGGPNFAQLPVNRPVAQVHHHQRDGYGQHRIDVSPVSYHPNTIGGGCPALGVVRRGRPTATTPSESTVRRSASAAESFKDFYSQATLFWNSMSDWEKQHIADAFRFELGKVERPHIRERVVANLAHVDHGLAIAGRRRAGSAGTAGGAAKPRSCLARRSRRTISRRARPRARSQCSRPTEPTLRRFSRCWMACENRARSARSLLHTGESFKAA